MTSAKHKKTLTAVVVAMVSLAVLNTAHDDTAVASHTGFREYQIKAAYLFNFAKFVAWPESDAPATELILCVLGDDPFGGILDAIESKTVRGRSLVVHRAEGVDDLIPCDILFISDSERGHIDEVLAAIDSSATLTVSDIDGFIEIGGMVNFYLSRQNTIRFAINAVEAERAGLKISSKLLSLSKRADG